MARDFEGETNYLWMASPSREKPASSLPGEKGGGGGGRRGVFGSLGCGSAVGGCDDGGRAISALSLAAVNANAFP